MTPGESPAPTRLGRPPRHAVIAAVLALAVAACHRTPGSPARAAHAAAAPSRPPLVYVTNEGSGDLTVIDSATDEVVATVKLGKRPRGVHLDATGERIFVAISGKPIPGARRFPEGPPPEGIGVVDAAKRALATVLPAGEDPESFAVLADGRTLVVSNEDSASVTFVDAAAARDVATVEVGREPEGVTASPGGEVVAVASERDARLELVDPAAHRLIASVPTCGRPRMVAFAPDGALAFASCEEPGQVQIVDVRGRKADGVIQLPAESRPMGLAMSPDGARLYVSNGNAGTVSAIDVAARKVVATAERVGARCWGIALTPDGRKLYVANGKSNDVSVVDTASMSVVKRIAAGSLPWGVAISR
ncbi:MAG TPA: beta-propeller fold lactonase family protein [Anaeromyxobacter sp.]|nr:beta-propeller fold lactonase family protein [Anaeromyxobacter sp.]